MGTRRAVVRCRVGDFVPSIAYPVGLDEVAVRVEL